jgi:hypothetical protein
MDTPDRIVTETTPAAAAERETASWADFHAGLSKFLTDMAEDMAPAIDACLYVGAALVAEEAEKKAARRKGKKRKKSLRLAKRMRADMANYERRMREENNHV